MIIFVNIHVLYTFSCCDFSLINNPLEDAGKTDRFHLPAFQTTNIAQEL